MHSTPLKKLMGEELDKEWMELIKQAKEAGLTVTDVRRLLKSAPYMEEAEFTKYKSAE